MIYEVKGLCFAYPYQEKLLENVSFSLHEGEIITVLGRNGAGKSTLLSCLLGELKPQNGEIKLNGNPLSSLTAREIAQTAGYVPQSETGIFSFSVLDYVMMGCACDLGLFSRPGKKERAAAKAALEILGISQLADRPYPNLSGGEQQQCTIARAIVRNPKAVLLDEPASHLDVPNRIRLLRMVKSLSERGYGIILTTHDPDHALMLGGGVLLFEGTGTVTSGPANEIITEERLHGIYGNDLRVAYLNEAGRRVCICPGL